MVTGLDPSEEVDNQLIIAEGLHLRWHEEAEAPTEKRGELLRMRDAHAAKVPRVQLDADAHNNADFRAGERFQLMQEQGMTRAEADAEIAERRAFYNAKVAKLTEVVRLCNEEVRLRTTPDKVDRLPGLLALRDEPDQQRRRRR